MTSYVPGGTCSSSTFPSSARTTLPRIPPIVCTRSPCFSCESISVRFLSWFFFDRNTKKYKMIAIDLDGTLLAPDADRLTLVRRIYFDLLGLPPAAWVEPGFLEARAHPADRDAARQDHHARRAGAGRDRDCRRRRRRSETPWLNGSW